MATSIEQANIKIAELQAKAEEARSARSDAGARKSEASAMKQKYAFLKNQITKNVEGFKKVQKGIVGAILNPGIPSQAAFYGPASGGSQPGRGRGRPTGTYTYVIPGVGPVPIQAYKRWQSQQRAMQRVQNELAKARFNIQPSASEMPVGYGQYSAEDSFAGQDGPSAIQEMQMRQMQQQMAQQAAGQVNQPGMMQRFANRFGMPQQQMNMAPRAPMSPGYGNQVQRLTLWGRGIAIPKEQNILNAPNVFNRQGSAIVGFGAGRQQGY